MATEIKLKETPQTQPKAILFDFSWVLLHPKDRNYQGSLNGLNRKMGGEDGMGPYDFFNFFELNTELLSYIEKLKQRLKIPVYMFTTDIIQERPEIKGKLERVFNRIISGREIVKSGASKAIDLDGVKTDPESYKYIAEELHFLPHQLLFIDDKLPNIIAAQSIGYQVVQYVHTPEVEESNRQLFAKLDSIFGA